MASSAWAGRSTKQGCSFDKISVFSVLEDRMCVKKIVIGYAVMPQLTGVLAPLWLSALLALLWLSSSSALT